MSPTGTQKCYSSPLSHRWAAGTLHFCPGDNLLLAGQGVCPFQTTFFFSLVFQRRGLLPGAGVRDSSTQEVATFGCLGDLAEVEVSMLWSPVPRWEQCSPRGARGAGCGGGEVSRGFPVCQALTVEWVDPRAELCRESRAEHCGMGLDPAQAPLLGGQLWNSSAAPGSTFSVTLSPAGSPLPTSIVVLVSQGFWMLQDGSGPLAALILAKVLLPWAEHGSCSQCLEAGKLRPALSLVICLLPIHFSFAQCNSMSVCGIVPRGPRRVPTHTQPRVKPADIVIT